MNTGHVITVKIGDAAASAPRHWSHPLAGIVRWDGSKYLPSTGQQQSASARPVCAANQHRFDQRGRKRVCVYCSMVDGRAVTR